MTNVPSNILDCRIDDFAGSLVLFERIEAALYERLQARPKDRKLLFQLAACKRKQGKLSEALKLYQELSDQYPENPDYPYTISALKGELIESVPDTVEQPCACPLVEWDDFLEENTIQDVVEHMCKHQADFKQAQVGDGEKNGKSRYNPDARNNTSLSLSGSPLKAIVRALVNKRLPEITQKLGLAPFKASRIDVKLRAYHDGEYFRVHQDGGSGRLISFTYFFHPNPLRFKGGELITFDTDIVTSTFNHSFTRILPKRNSVFFFPSHYYHAVLPVETQDKDFMSARFVINGHIWIDKAGKK